MKRVFFLVLTGLILLSGCSLMDRSKPVETKASFVNQEWTLESHSKLAVEGLNALGFEALKAMPLEENQLISPVSLSLALGMVHNGGSESVRSNMQKTLGIEGLKTEDVNKIYNALTNEMRTFNENGPQVAIANSVWVSESRTLQQPFTETVKKWYDAQTYQVDFKSEGTIKAMNQWVKEETKGLIPQMFDKPFEGEELSAILMNTLYFKGKWKSDFDPNATRKETFTSLRGEKSDVDMMHQESWFEYFEDEAVQVATFPYQSKLCMKVILPKNDLKTTLEGADYQTFKSWLYASKTQSSELRVSMPKFKYEVMTPLKDFLLTTPMKDAFDKSSKPFPEMVDLKENETAWIGDIYQKTTIVNDEAGTEAAAVTVVEMETTAMPVEKVVIDFVMNKPFIYVIEDLETGAHLFIGRVIKP